MRATLQASMTNFSCSCTLNSNFVPRASRRVFRPVFKCEGKKEAEPFFSRAFEKRGEKLPDLTFACANCAFCAGEMNTRWWWFSWQHLYHCITISLYMMLCCVNMSAVWVVWNWTWVRCSKYWGIKSTCAAAGVFCRGHVSSLEIVCLYVFAVVCMCMVQQSDYSFVSLILATVMSSTTLSAVCFGWRAG